MPFQTAALVLAWVVIALLAFAMAGMLSMIRRLQAAQSQMAGSLVDGGGSARSRAAARFAPGTRPYALVLTASATCPSCSELMPRFRDFARRHRERVDFHVLSADLEVEDSTPDLPVTVDPAAFAALSPGYTPGLVIIDRQGTVVEVGPGGDLASVERWIDRQRLSRSTEERP